MASTTGLHHKNFSHGWGRSLLTTLMSLSLVAGCDAVQNQRSGTIVKGSGVVATESRPVSNFKAIKADGVGVINLHVGETGGHQETLVLSADNNLLPLLTTTVNNGVLELSTRENIVPESKIVYTITAKQIDSLDMRGVVALTGTGFTGESLSLDLSGTGTVALSGQVNRFALELSGVGNLQAGNLVADEVTASLSGIGNAKVRAEKKLRGEVSGIGNLEWRGRATDVSSEVQGLGRIKRVDDASTKAADSGSKQPQKVSKSQTDQSLMTLILSDENPVLRWLRSYRSPVFSEWA